MLGRRCLLHGATGGLQALFHGAEATGETIGRFGSLLNTEAEDFAGNSLKR
jgi:hypothetical protein